VHRTKMLTINADDSPEAIVNAMIAAPVTRLPFWREKPENIIGVVHVKDLLRALHAVDGDTAKLDIPALMSAPWFVPETRPLSEQLAAFRRRKTPFALVVDEYGAFQGVVTLEDILEEIVGKMGDAPERGQSGIRPSDGGSYIMSGDVTVRDVNRELGWDLPDDEAATIAGLVMHEARRIPEVRQVFAFHGFRFEILRKKNNRITALRVKPMNGEPARPGQSGAKAEAPAADHPPKGPGPGDSPG
ncbi:MAG: CBS domain-containing protein, partial [Rhodospirillaceae bacterium]|nr:CBS domain-containing protein [Rhodospirillaceae bacterium]